MKYLNLKSENGQSLIEILVAFSIFVVGISTIFFLVLDSNSSVRQGLERSQAVLLAQEGIEASKSIRDSGFGNLTNGVHGVILSGSNWSFSGTSDSQDQFIRAVTITEIDSDTKKIESNVNWPFLEFRPNNISFVSYLTNWQKASGKGGMLAYADISGDDDVIKYKILDAGGNWSVEQDIPDFGVPLNRMTRRLELYSSPIENEKILITKHYGVGAGNDQLIYAQVWNGFSWDNAIQLAGWDNATRPEVRDFDGAYLDNGNFIVVYEDNTNIIKYRIWNGTGWTGQFNGPNIGDNPEWVILRNKVGTDEAMLSVLDAALDTNTSYWNGLSWGAVTQHASNSNTLGPEIISFEWSPNNSNIGALVFNEANDNLPNIKIWDGSSWSASIENINIGGSVRALESVGRPGADEFLACFKDSANDINCLESNFSPQWSLLGEMETDTDNGAQRSFDMVYEGSGLMALSIYSGLPNQSIPKYRTFNPATNITSSELSLVAIGDILETVRSIPDPNGNDILFLMGASDQDIYSIIWDGTNNIFYPSGGKAQMEHGRNGSDDLDFWFDFAWDN